MRSMPVSQVVVLSLLLLGSGIAFPQSPAKQEPPASPEPKKATLQDATRVSTKEVAHEAAQEKARKGARTASEDSSSDAGVSELHPAPPGEEHPTVSSAKSSKKSTAKSVHGTVYGATGTQGPAQRGAGANAGVTSKSGKTSIYVETEKSRETSSPPH